MKHIIGMTGPTGAGKSSVADIASTLGFKVVDCDTLARKAVEKGTQGLAAVVKAFGCDILNTDGTLNRKALAKAAFASNDKTKLLNQTLLPFIVELVNEQIGDNNLVLLDAPTLFESGADRICTGTFAVLSDPDTRKSRIMARDGISEAEATLRMNAGKSDEFYKAKTANIIYNNGDISQFKFSAKTLLNNLIGGK